MGVFGYFPQIGPELIDPSLDISLRTVAEETILGICHHPLATYVYLLPASEIRQKLEMETLIAVFLRAINIVGYTTWLFLKSICQKRIYP